MKEAPLSRTNAIAQENDLTQSPQGKSLQPPGFSLTAEEGQAPMQFYDEKKAQKTRCEKTGEATDFKWLSFAYNFNKHFKSILHVFSDAAMKCQMEAPSSEKIGNIGRKGVYDKATKKIIYEESPAKETFTDLPENYDLGSEAANAKNAPDAKPGDNGYVGKGKRSGQGLTVGAAASLFTIGQRDKLSGFMETNMIPDLLFNGTDVGNTTAQQRILISAIILSRGKYVQGSVTQKVHARMCWHWAHITNDYAGTAVGAFNAGTMGTTDMNGNTMMNAGEASTYFNGPFEPASKLPSKEEQGYGPIPKGSKQDETLSKEEKKYLESADPSSFKHAIGRKQGMNWNQLSLIEPGDWLWVFNANGSNIGCHSVIFSHWASDVVTKNVALDPGKPKDLTTVQFRKAVFFSQGKPDSGGKEHENYISTQFLKVPRIEEATPDPTPVKEGEQPKPPIIKVLQEDFTIIPVTWATRFSPDSNPALSAAEMVKGYTLSKLNGASQKFLKEFEKKHKGKIVDLDQLLAFLRQRAQTDYVPKLFGLIPMQQISALMEAIDKAEIGTVVMLMQRIEKLAFNEQLAEQMGEANILQFEENHAAWVAKKVELEAEVTRLEESVGMADAEIGVYKEAKSEVDLLDLKKRKGQLEYSLLPPKVAKGKKKPKPKSAAEIAAIEKELETVKERIAQIESSKESKESAKSDLAAINKELAKLNKRIAPDRADLVKAKKELVKHLEKEPYSSVHPGNWLNVQDKSMPSGNLSAVITTAELVPLLVEKPVPPQKGASPKADGGIKNAIQPE